MRIANQLRITLYFGNSAKYARKSKKAIKWKIIKFFMLLVFGTIQIIKKLNQLSIHS